MKFDWDDNNINHIARHGVTPEEVEQIFNDSRKTGISCKQIGQEKSKAIIGSTPYGRTLHVIFTRREGKIRVITARNATPQEKRLYRR